MDSLAIQLGQAQQQARYATSMMTSAEKSLKYHMRADGSTKESISRHRKTYGDAKMSARSRVNKLAMLMGVNIAYMHDAIDIRVMCARLCDQADAVVVALVGHAKKFEEFYANC